MSEIYFDNASTTKMRPEVLEVMLPYFNEHYGNAAGLNNFSKKAKKALDDSREIIAATIGCTTRRNNFYFWRN